MALPKSTVKSKEAVFKLIPRVALMMKVFGNEIEEAIQKLGRKIDEKELKKVLLKHFMLNDQTDLDALVTN